MTFGFPMDSFVYLIFAVIDAFALSPIPGSENADYTRSIGEPNGQNTSTNYTKAEESRLLIAMRHILRDHTARVCKCRLCFSKADAMFKPILLVLRRIPIE